MGGRSSSKSETSTDNSATNIDASIGLNSGESFVVSSKGDVNFTYSNEFSEPVQQAFQGILDASGEVINNVLDITKSTFLSGINSAQAIAAKSQELVSQAAQPDVDLIKNLSKTIPLIIGGSLLAIVLILKK